MASLYRKACVGGVMWGCDFLGEVYEQGLGVRIDLPEARRLYKKACDSGGGTTGCTDYARIQNK